MIPRTILLLFLLFPPLSWAGPSRTGGALLQRPFGARPYALAQAYTGLGDDVFGLAYNPAILSRLKESQLATQFSQSLEDNRTGYIGFASPLNPNHALGISAAYFDAGRAEIFDNTGRQTGNVNAQRDLLIHLGYSGALPVARGRLHLGTAIKTLQSTVADEVRASAYAVDFGALYERKAHGGLWSIGAAAANLGSPLKYTGGAASGSEADPLPLALRWGAGYTRRAFASDAIAAGVQVERILHDDLTYQSLAFEYSYRGLCALRFGYRLGEDLGGLRMGLGFAIKGVSIDYGIGLIQNFNSTQHVSLHYRFEIPGVRYAKDLESITPLEKMARDLRAQIDAGRFFNAQAGIEAMENFFPNASQPTQFKADIRRRLAPLISDLSSARHAYALGFQSYQEGNWEEAVRALELAERSARHDPEIAKHLAKARDNLRSAQSQVKLQKQARIGTLFELASQAAEAGDFARARRILGELLRVGPYRPANTLINRIDMEERASRKKDRRKKPVRKPTPTKPSIAQDPSAADELYYGALQAYADNRAVESLEMLKRALKLDAANQHIRTTHDRIEFEVRQRKQAP